MQSDKKTLILVTATSGSGKDWLLNKLEEEDNVPILRSFATRPKRTPDENGYTFIKLEDVNDYFQSVFQGFVDVKTGNLYFTTKELLEKTIGDGKVASIIVTPQSVIPIAKELKEKYKILYVHMDSDEELRIENMRRRGDTEENIKNRIENMDVEICKHYNNHLLDYNTADAELLEHFCFQNSDVAYLFLKKMLKYL